MLHNSFITAKPTFVRLSVYFLVSRIQSLSIPLEWQARRLTLLIHSNDTTGAWLSTCPILNSFSPLNKGIFFTLLLHLIKLDLQVIPLLSAIQQFSNSAIIPVKRLFSLCTNIPYRKRKIFKIHAGVNYFSWKNIPLSYNTFYLWFK